MLKDTVALSWAGEDLQHEQGSRKTSEGSGRLPVAEAANFQKLYQCDVTEVREPGHVADKVIHIGS